MARLVLVDDDRNIVESLSVFFAAEGFDVAAFHDGLTALAEIERESPDLAVLDIKMPRMDGMELLKRLRQKSEIPAIFLTSKDDEIDEYEGFNIGADDYVRKPCSNRLLAERVKAVLRRARGSQDSKSTLMRRGRLVLDLDRHLCSWGAEPIRLTVTEFLILQSLVERPGHVKSRDQLMDSAYDDQIYVDDRTIDSHIKRIRKKFRDRDSDFDGIETLYGVGYCYREMSET